MIRRVHTVRTYSELYRIVSYHFKIYEASDHKVTNSGYRVMK